MALKKLWYSLFMVLITATCDAQEVHSPEGVVEENLEFYNKRDIDGFMRSFSDSIVLHTWDNLKEPVIGKPAIRMLYASLFNESPQLHSTIKQRILLGNKVIDHELIVGRRGSPTPIELIMIYEVVAGKIQRMTVIRE